MKKIALSVVALALTAGSALAADLPSRKAAPILPPPPPPPPMWVGFYVGLNAGGTWANSNQQTIGVGPVASTSNFGARGVAEVAAFSSAASASGFNGGGNGGFIGGGQIGYNWQFFNSFIGGVEADIQGLTGNNGSRTFMTAAPTGYGDSWVGIHSVRGNLDYIGTVRGRLGWLFTPTMMVYGTGGLAYGGVSLNTATTVYNDTFSNFVAPATGGVNFSNTQVGWTAGAGLEWMFWPNWSLKAEYLYYDLGSVTQNFAIPVTASFGPVTDSALFGGQARARINGNIVRAGVNYHFNWGAPAPVVAKY